MKHNMQELTLTELEAICGGGFWEEVLGGIGRFIDWLIGQVQVGAEKVKELYLMIQQGDVAV